MTEPEKGLAERAAAPQTSGPQGREDPSLPRASAASRVREWFWSGGTMRTLSDLLPQKTVRELDRRARLSLELSRVALEQSFHNGSAEAIACELGREAVYWALLALHEFRTESSAEGERLAAPRPTLAELWAKTDASFLARSAGGEAEAAAIGNQIREATFTDLAALDGTACARLTVDLVRVANAAIQEIDQADGEVDRIWMRRVVRLGGVVVLGAMLAAAAPRAWGSLVHIRDLAWRQPWTASSKYEDGGCASPLQSCPDSPHYFFHTLEEVGPWLSIDIQSIRNVSGIRVVNRQDCCMERALPLVVEVSTDQKHWHEVARRAEGFTVWKSKFAPTPARWVRLTVPRTTFLHLQEVRVLR